MTNFVVLRKLTTGLVALLLLWSPVGFTEVKVNADQLERLQATNARVKQILAVKQDFQRRYPGLNDLFESLANRVVTAEFFPNNLRQIPMMVTVVGGSAIGKSVAIEAFYRAIGVKVSLRQIGEGETEVPVDAITELASPGLEPIPGRVGAVILDEGHNLQTAAGLEFKRSQTSHRLPVYGGVDKESENRFKRLSYFADRIADGELRRTLLDEVGAAEGGHSEIARRSRTRSALDILWSLWGMSVFQVEATNQGPAGLEKLRQTLGSSLNQIESMVANSPTSPEEIISQSVAELQKIENAYDEIVNLYIRHQPNVSPVNLMKYRDRIKSYVEYLTKGGKNWWEIYPTLSSPILYQTPRYGSVEDNNNRELQGTSDPNLPDRLAKSGFGADNFEEPQREQLIAAVRRVVESLHAMQMFPSIDKIAEQIKALNNEIKSADHSNLITEINATPGLFGELKRMATEAHFKRTPGHYFLKLLTEDPIQLAQVLERVYSSGLQPYNAFGVTVIILANDVALQSELRKDDYPTADARREAASRKLREYPGRRRALDILYGMFGAPSNPEAFESRAGEIFYYEPTSDVEWRTKLDALVNEKLREIELEARKRNLNVDVQLSPAVTARLSEVLIGANTTTRTVLARLALLATPSYELVDQLQRQQGQPTQRVIRLELSDNGDELQFREKGRTLVSFAVSNLKDPSEGGTLQKVSASAADRRRLVWAASKTVVGALFTSSVPTFQQVGEESTRMDRWWNMPDSKTIEYNLTRASLALVTCASEIAYLGGQTLSGECQKDRALARHYIESAIDILKERSRVVTGSTTIYLARLNLPPGLQTLARLAGMERGDATDSVNRLAELIHYLVLVCDPVTQRLLASYEKNGVQMSAAGLSQLMQASLPSKMVSDMGVGYWNALATNPPGFVADIQQTPFGNYSGFQQTQPSFFSKLMSRLFGGMKRPSRAETTAKANMTLNHVTFAQCSEFLATGPSVLRNNPLNRK